MENSKAIAQKLRELADLFDGNTNSTNATAAKTYKKAPKGDDETLSGIIAYPERKEGVKAQFMVWNLKNTAKGDVSCKTFDGALFDLIVEGQQVNCVGNFQEWKGYSSFNVKFIEAKGEANDGTTKPTPINDDLNDDDVPF